MKVYKIQETEYKQYVIVVVCGPTFCKIDYDDKEGTLFYSFDCILDFLKSYCEDCERFHKTRKIEPVKNKYDWVPEDWKIVEFDLVESGQNNSAREVLKNV